MATDMQKTPSYLKGLAETRARADGDVQRLQQILKEVKRKLAEATAARDSCDLLIRRFDERLDPEQIAPIRATKGKYGKHGGLIGAARDIIKESWPDAISSDVIAIALESQLKLSFASHKERYRWTHNSLGNALKDLRKQGYIDRLHDPLVPGSECGRWRWKPEAATQLSELRQAAESTATTVTQAKRRGRPRKAEQPAPELA